MDDIYITSLHPQKKVVMVEAPFWKRLLAVLVDLLVIDTFLLFPFQAIVTKMITTDDIFSMLTFQSISDSSNMPFIMAIAVIGSVVAWLYFVLLEAKINQTLGKMVMGITVVNEDQKKKVDVEPIGIFRSMVRSLPILLVCILPFVVLADAITLFFNPEKRRLLERLSKTKTVLKDSV